MKLIKLKRRISLDDVFLFVALLCVSTFALLEHTSNSIPLFSYLKMPMMYLGAICLLPQIKIIFNNLNKRRYIGVVLALLLLIVLLIYSMIANRNPIYGESPLKDTVRLVLFLLELFLLMIVLAERGKAKSTVRFLFWYVLIIVAVNDFLLFTRLITFRAGRFETYLVGTKFSVAYLHMYLLTLWVMNSNRSIRTYRKAIWKVLLAAVYIVGVSARVDCMTGVIGCLVLVVLFVVSDSPNIKRILHFTSPWMLLLFLIGSVVFVFAADAIMSVPTIRYLVEDVFGRDVTLTGRTNIYDQYVSRMPGHWLAGYGYGNGNITAVTVFGYENVQNALLQWVLQVGVPATCALVGMMLMVFKRISLKDEKRLLRVLPLVTLIYMFVVLGMVETSFNMAFIMWFAMIFMLVNEKSQNAARRRS